MSSAGPRVVVVGAGVAGGAVALELAGRGAEVTVLDRPAEGRATGAAAGMLAAQYESEPSEPLFRLASGSRAVYAEFVARVEDLSGWTLDHRTDGMLVANRTAAETEAARATLEEQRAAGHGGSVVSPDRARELHRDAAAEVDSYVWLPDEGQVDAQRLPSALHRALRAEGAEVRPGSPARSLSEGGGPGGRLEVRLAGDRRLEADAVVVAAGAWSSRLDGLPRSLQMEPVKGQMVRLDPGRAPPSPLLADHDGHYVVPREDGTVVVGSTMERTGFDADPDPDTVAALEEAAARLAPSLAGSTRREAWSGLRPVTADGRPVLGPEPLMAGLHYATGYGRNGILVSPLAGRAVADLILEGASEVEWEPFSAERLPEATAWESDRLY